MYTIKTKIEEVVKEFDFVSDWVDTICKMILKKEKEEDTGKEKKSSLISWITFNWAFE